MVDYVVDSGTELPLAGNPFVNVWGINLEGAVVGWSRDTSGVFHGLVAQPQAHGSRACSKRRELIRLKAYEPDLASSKSGT